MINLNVGSTILLTVLLLLILTLCFIDYRKKRGLTKKPFVSFLIPCFNDSDTVAETIESVYNSYDNFEIIVVNDCSTDNSLDVLKDFKKKFAFTLANNTKNCGKSCTLNKIYKFAKSDILFFLDADVLLTKRVVYDILARLEGEDVCAASAPYQPRNKGFLPVMQEIEYNMLSFIQGAHNFFSTVSIWGGCFAIRKKAFEDVHGFSEHAITEDIDLALKLKKAGYRVEQSFCSVKTYVPDKIGPWFRQKLRWSSGGAQNFIKHFSVLMKNPLNTVFIYLFFMLSFFFAVSLFKQITFIENIFESFTLLTETTNQLLTFKIMGFYYGVLLLKNLLITIYFAAFSIPYAIPMIGNIKEIYKLLYVIPFSLIYLPIFSVVSCIGFIMAAVRYRSLKEGKRAW
jgi:biofilm PGA synthesis N-glycosyltransferase PgaC